MMNLFYDALCKHAQSWYEKHPADVHPAQILLALDDGSSMTIQVNNLMFDDRAIAIVRELHRCSLDVEGVLFSAMISEGFAMEPEKDPDDTYETLIINILSKDNQSLMSLKIDREAGTFEKRPFAYVGEDDRLIILDGLKVRR